VRSMLVLEEARGLRSPEWLLVAADLEAQRADLSLAPIEKDPPPSSVYWPGEPTPKPLIWERGPHACGARSHIQQDSFEDEITDRLLSLLSDWVRRGRMGPPALVPRPLFGPVHRHLGRASGVVCVFLDEEAVVLARGNLCMADVTDSKGRGSLMCCGDIEPNPGPPDNGPQAREVLSVLFATKDMV
jgi:hypothetical protein